MNLLLEFLYGLLKAGDELVETKIENVLGNINTWLDEAVASTDTKFDDKAKEIVCLAVRDKLIKLYPLETYPLD